MTKGHLQTVPFNGVDSLMRGLDEPNRPQTIELEVALVERLEEQRLRDAVTTAASRHPFARVRQVRSKIFDLDYIWEIDDALRTDPVKVCVCTAPGEVDVTRDAFFSKRIELDAAAPFRVLLIHEEAGDRVMLSANHTAFDGIGSIRLLQSISRAYAGQEDPLSPVDPIAARDILEHQVPRSSRRGAAINAPSLKLPVRPTRLASARSRPAAGFGILHFELEPAQAAPPDYATINDVLVAALHCTIENWNRSHGVASGRVTTMMPVNQRPKAWRSDVVANLVLPGQVQSTPAERAQPQSLLAAVAAQTNQIKTEGVASATGVRGTARLPVMVRGLLPHLVDAVADWTADTAVLTNLGRVEDPPWFGGKGRGLWFGAPPRAPVNLTVGAATAGDRLGMSLRWCKPALSRVDARTFADEFLASLIAVRATDSCN